MSAEEPETFGWAACMEDERLEGPAPFGWKPCMNCGERRPDTSVFGGWCSSCAGEGQTAAEVHRSNMQATLLNAEKLLEIKRRRRDPVREVTWWEGRIAAIKSALSHPSEER